MDPYKFLNISLNPDGSLTRSSTIPIAPPSASGDGVALSKDVPLDPDHKTSLRIFIPSGRRPSLEKLPVVVDFHGGGLVFFSPATAPFHHASARIAAETPAIVLSVDYRLAPEHRLPAAYEDAADALLWLRDQARNPAAADPWISAHADFSRCFLMGNSAGGNIAYHAAIGTAGLDLEPLKLDGLILYQPYFGGKDRTESETRLADDKILPLPATDLMWELALPRGVDRDHEYCNPNMGKGIFTMLPRCLVKGQVGDPLIDRHRELARMLERGGVRVVAMLDEEGCHGAEVFWPEKAVKLVADVKAFVWNYSTTGAVPVDLDCKSIRGLLKFE